jgi:O-antigen/teichoic acid export membrane protein
MWSNRAQYFRALAISRVLQYGGAAVLQVVLGLLLWAYAREPAAADAAWALAVAPVLAAVIAALVLVRPAPAGGWRVVFAGDTRMQQRRVAVKFRDFPLLNTPHAFLGALQDALAVAILVALSGHAAAGFWGLALRYLKAPATLVGSAVSQALYPRLAGAQPADAQRAVRQIMALLGAVALALMLALMVVGPWLFRRVFGEQWREAGELARALAPYIAVHFVAAPLSVVTMAWKAQRWALFLSIIGQIIFLIALIFGLKFGGLVGGGWAVSGAMSIYFLYFLYKLAIWKNQK